jgi:hypothetical protein
MKQTLKLAAISVLGIKIHQLPPKTKTGTQTPTRRAG